MGEWKSGQNLHLPAMTRLNFHFTLFLHKVTVAGNQVQARRWTVRRELPGSWSRKVESILRQFISDPSAFAFLQATSERNYLTVWGHRLSHWPSSSEDTAWLQAALRISSIQTSTVWVWGFCHSMWNSILCLHFTDEYLLKTFLVVRDRRPD